MRKKKKEFLTCAWLWLFLLLQHCVSWCALVPPLAGSFLAISFFFFLQFDSRKQRISSLLLRWSIGILPRFSRLCLDLNFVVSALLMLLLTFQFFLVRSWPLFPRLQLGAILNIHRFFRVLAKPLTWAIYYSAVHFAATAIMEIANGFLYYKNTKLTHATS